jgi:hypothetical protein
MSLLHLEVVLKKANRKSDDSVTVAFETTSEMSNEQFAHIDSFRKTVGHLVFSKDSIKGSDIPKGPVDEKGLSPSQLLKKSLYATWSAKTERKMTSEDWETYYANAIMGFKRAVDRSHPDND